MVLFFLLASICGGQEKDYCLVFPDGMSWDFGKAGEEDGKLEHVFRFTNGSSDTVAVVNINTYCRCTEASVTKRVFLPGETGEIRVSFDPYGYPGRISKSIRVTARPGDDFLLSFSADITPRVKPVEEEYPLLLSSGMRFEDSEFTFPAITAGTSVSRELRCINTSDVPVEVSVDGVSGILEVESPGIVPPGGKASVVMRYSAAHSLEDVGFHRDSFYVRAGGYYEKIPVYVRASVIEDFTETCVAAKPAVSISDSYINLHDVRSSEPDRHVGYTLRNIGKAPLSVRAVSCPDGISCSLRPGSVLDPGQTCRFEVVIDISRFPEGKFLGTVRVMTNDPVRPVKDIMISARIIE